MIMQRMIESTVINELLIKYQTRFDKCQAQWEKDCQELKDGVIDANRKDFLLTDISNINIQLSAYECIVKDLKELIK